MGNRISQQHMRHRVVVSENLPVDHPSSPWIKYVLESHYFKNEIVVSLKSLVIMRNNLIGVCMPNQMDTMLIFVQRHSLRNKHKIIEFRTKMTRWPFQNVFFPIGEISLGVQDVRSGAMIHAMRTGCLQEGQTVRVLVLKRGSPARLLPAARSQHWAQQNNNNYAIVDMFEQVRERERYDEVDEIQREGMLKIFYVNEKVQYIRETSRGPIDPDEIPFDPHKEITIQHPVARSVFVWFILVSHDGQVFQSRQIRVYSRMFFRNKFGMHASAQFEAQENEALRLLQKKKEEEGNNPQIATADSVHDEMHELEKVASVKPAGTRTTMDEEQRLERMVNRTTEETQEDALKVSPEQLSENSDGGKALADVE